MKNARTVLKTAASKQIRKHRTPAMLKPIVGALLAGGLASSAHAIDTIWFGGSGDWGVGTNWSQGIPGAGDVAVISAGTATLGLIRAFRA